MDLGVVALGLSTPVLMILLRLLLSSVALAVAGPLLSFSLAVL